MKAIYFSDLDYKEGTADVVYCPDCDTNMLVPFAMNFCPVCGEELQWGKTDNGEFLDGENGEVIIRDFLAENKVEITTTTELKNKLKQ